MKTRMILLAIGILLIGASLSVNSIAAQEPTQEPEQPSAVVVSSNNEPQTLPAADIVVVQQETPQEPEKDTIAGIIEKLTVPIIAVTGFIMLMLSSKNREKVKGVGEVVEDVLWASTLAASELVTAFEGNPNVIVSTDPKVLAAALKTGDKHVLIRHGVKFDDVLKEYTTPT